MKNKLSIFLSIALLSSVTLNAKTLKEAVTKVLIANPEVIAQTKNQEAFKKYVDEREGGYLPDLDLTGRAEISNTDQDFKDNTPDNSIQEDGYNLGLTLNQLLYDGGLTPSLVREAEFNDLANTYRANREIDTVVLETANAYMNYVQFDERLVLTNDMIDINKDNLKSAEDKQAISGEILEIYQVKSKLSFLQDKYYEEKDLINSSVSTYFRYVGEEPTGNECRPEIDKTKVPETLEKAILFAVENNIEIKEQVNRAKAQEELIAQSDANFLPNFNLELGVSTDNDLSLDENGEENLAFGRINLTWNLYNGGSDKAVNQQQAIFLAEQKKRLDGITRKVVENVKTNYERYTQNQNRIKALKEYVVANENIVQVYKNEFEAGTRTFVDILDAQTILYEAKKNLIIRENNLVTDYYALMNDFSILRKSILDSTEVCQEKSPESKIVSNSSETLPETAMSNELLSLLDDTPKEEIISGLYEDLMAEFKDDFAKWNAELDKNGLIFRFKKPGSLFGHGSSKLATEYKEILDNFYPRYIDVISKYKNEIAEVRIEGHTSSVYRSAKTVQEKYAKNKALSQKRANEVYDYTMNINNQSLSKNKDWLKNNYKSYGMSSDNLVYNSDGTENQELSRRVEFRINKI